MSIISRIKGLFTSENEVDENDNKPLDVDKKTGLPIYKDDIIANIVDALNERKEERHPLETQWTLNNNFINGNQLCEIDTTTGTIEQQEEVYDWLERENFNRIAPIIETRIANLKKLNFVMNVTPRTNELEDYHKADISTQILRFLQSNSNFDEIKNLALWWNEICGSVFFLSFWNPNKGEVAVKYNDVEIGPDNVEKVVEKQYFDGDIDYGIINAYEVYPESITKQTVEEQRSIIIEQVKTVDEIYDLYGIEVDGKEIDSLSLGQVETSSGFGKVQTLSTITHGKIKNAAKIITFFERPSRNYPKGRLAIIVDETELVFYGDLPYENIPLIKMVCKNVPGQFFGKSCVQEMIPLQRAYNGIVNRIHEYIKDFIFDGYIAEEGSIDVDNYEENAREPGAIVFYKQGFQKPEPIPNGMIPATVINEKHELESNMEYVAGVSQMMVYGRTPNGVTSGTAINSLREIDNTRLALTGDCIRSAVIRLAKDWLHIYKRYATISRVINITGLNDIGGAIVWDNSDINSFDVKFDTTNELILSEDLQRERFIESLNMGLFTDANGVIPQRVKLKMLEVMKVGNYSEIMAITDLDRQAAQRENVLFERGILPQIHWYDDNDIHIEEHKRYILQMRFRMLQLKNPELAGEMENHLKMHQDVKDFKAQEEMGMNQLPIKGGGMNGQ